MSPSPFILSQKHVRIGQMAFGIAVAIVCIAVTSTAFRFFGTQAHTAQLANLVRTQKDRLAELRRNAELQPLSERQSVAPSGDAVARIQADLARRARAVNCTIEEFQASPDRTPYLSVFTLDTNRPDWQQIPVQVSLRGTLAATCAAVDSLRTGGIPVEPDSLEISRQAISERGDAVVSLRLGFRVLVRTDGGTCK